MKLHMKKHTCWLEGQSPVTFLNTLSDELNSAMERMDLNPACAMYLFKIPQGYIVDTIGLYRRNHTHSISLCCSLPPIDRAPGVQNQIKSFRNYSISFLR